MLELICYIVVGIYIVVSLSIIRCYTLVIIYDGISANYVRNIPSIKKCFFLFWIWTEKGLVRHSKRFY